MNFNAMDAIWSAAGAALTLNEANALAKCLEEHVEGKDENGAYKTIIEFLWAANRIELTQKLDLLDLI